MRFREFGEQWERMRLGEVSEISSGGTPSRANSSYWNGDIPWVSTSLIDFNIIIDTEEKITEEGLRNSSAKLFPKGSLLMAMYGQGKTRGKVATLGIEATTNQACASIITNNELLNCSFLFYNLSKRYEEIRDLSNRGGQENLSGTIIKGIEIVFPSLTEQKKVADFFTLLNERISTQRKIIEESRILNKVLRKKLLSKQLRFSEFKEEWKEVKLGEVCEKQSSNISANQIEDNSGEYIIYGASGNLKRIDFYEVENDYISIVKDGAGVGRLLYCKGKSSVLGTLDAIKPNRDVDTYFLYCLLSRIDFSRHTTGSTIPHIYFKDYANEEMRIPALEEQQAISNCLSAFDQKVEVEINILKKLNLQKQYLLQQMFI